MLVIGVQPGKSAHPAVLLPVGEQGGNVEPAPRVDTASHVRNCADGETRLVHELRGPAADVAEALHGDGRLRDLHAEALACLDRDDVHTASGRARATLAAADLERLAGHRRGDRVAGLHRERVHDPRHDLGGRVHVRRRDVRLRSHQHADLGGEPPGQALELTVAQRRGVDGDTALGAAVGEVRERALPCHPHRERLDLVDVGRRMEPETTLGRTASHVVLDAVSLEHADAAVVHLHRETHDQLPSNLTQNSAQPR